MGSRNAHVLDVTDIQPRSMLVVVFAARSSVLFCDLTTAQHYGQTKNALRAKGRPIPENDLWIAAIALQYGLVLVTRDDHFSLIDGLLLANW